MKRFEMNGKVKKQLIDLVVIFLSTKINSMKLFPIETGNLKMDYFCENRLLLNS